MKTAITKIEGRGVHVPGDDIDTDQIIPAQHMRSVTFDDLGQYAFYNVRFDAKGRSLGHPLDDPRSTGASVLVVHRNFGCGSSREHAPQALKRFGFQAIIGVSFAEIFADNCATIGVPAIRLGEADIKNLAAILDRASDTVIRIDLEKKTVTVADFVFPIEMPEGARKALVNGTWDTVFELVKNKVQAEKIAMKLPYP